MIISLLGYTILTITIAWAITWFLYVRRLLFMKPAMPGPIPLPIVGNTIIALQENFNSFRMNSRVQEYGSLARFYLGHYGAVMVGSPEHLQKVFTSSAFLDRPPSLTGLGKHVFGRTSILMANGQEWKHARPLMGQALHAIPQSFLFEKMVLNYSGLVQELDPYVGNGFFSIFPILAKSSARIVLQTAFTSNLKDESTYASICDFEEVLDIIYQRCYSPIHYFDLSFSLTSAGRRYRQIWNTTNKLANSVLDTVLLERAECLSKGTPLPNTFLHNYLETCGEDTREEQLAHIRTIYGSSLDTSVSELCFVMLMLGMHPEVQERLYDEDKLIQAELVDGKVEFSDIYKYEYLERTIKETLRIYPIAHTGARYTTTDVQFGKYPVPKGTIVFMNFMHMHRNEKYFPDPLTFKPDRFLEADKFVPYSFLPFGAGKRGCPGYKFAMMAMKCAMIPIIRNFRITSKYKTIAELDSKLTGSITLKDSQHYQVKLERRN